MNFSFTDDAWDEYVAWQSEDKKTLKRINELLKSIKRDGLMKGIGKPEKLKNRDEYSRKIDEKNRLLYIGDLNSVIVTSCKGHYED